MEFKEAYAESDGFHDICVFFGVVPPEEFELLTKEMILKIAEQMPLKIFYKDERGHLAEVVWMNSEYVSIHYGHHSYRVVKRMEIGLGTVPVPSS